MIGFMLDGARALDNRSYYHRFIDFIADRGADTLLWHFSDDQGCAIRFDALPAAASPNAYSKDEARELSAYARTRGVMLIPELASLGHTRYITGTAPAYAALSETDDFFSSMCPVSPDTRRVIADLLDEVIDTFDSPLIHVGLDEVNLGGHPLTAAAMKTQSAGQIFADYVQFLYGRVRARGRRMMMWGDFLLKSADAVADLPRDILVANWAYDPAVTIDTTEILLAYGFEVVACPALISFNQPLIAGESWAYPNIREMASHRKRASGVVGTITTVWTPTRYLSESLWPGVDYAAAVMRGNGVAPVASSAAGLGESFFGMTDAGPFAAAMDLLAEVAPRRSLWLPTVRLEIEKLRQNPELPAQAAQLDRLARMLESCRPQVTRSRPAYHSLQLAADLLAHAWRRAEQLIRGTVTPTLVDESQRLSSQLSAAWDEQRFADDPRRQRPASHFDDGDHLQLAFDQGTEVLRTGELLLRKNVG